MAKEVTFNIRINPDVKALAENVYSRFGITLSDAINVFLRKSILVGGLPFEMRSDIPNEETLAAMVETENILSGRLPAKQYSNSRELFYSIGIEDDADADD